MWSFRQFVIMFFVIGPQVILKTQSAKLKAKDRLNNKSNPEGPNNAWISSAIYCDEFAHIQWCNKCNTSF